MIRPCFLVIDRDLPGSISTRKLVAETAKYNVITAYSAGEAVETLKVFPNVSGIVLDRHVSDMSCQTLIHSLKAIAPKMPLLLIETPSDEVCDSADFTLSYYTPEGFLEALKQMVPAQAAQLAEHEIKLEETF